MLPVETIGILEVEVPTSGERTPLAAASSLVRTADHLYVVADDLRGLAVFEDPETTLGHMIPLAEEQLATTPQGGDDKADLEGLCFMPPTDAHAYGALFALGSGSSPQRTRGVLVPLGPDARPEESHPIVELAPLYDALAERLPHLNLEGAAVVGDTLRLLHRANQGGENAMIGLDLAAASKEIEGGALTERAFEGIVAYDLGRLQGVPLCFSDASPLEDGRMVFVASAETSPEGDADGDVIGSAIGLMGQDGDVRFLEPIDVPAKIEGMTARIEGDVVELYLVTDQDDDEPSPLLRARLPL